MSRQLGVNWPARWSRAVLLGAVAAMASAAVIAAVLRGPGTPPAPAARVTRGSFDRVRAGMTRAEVIAAVGAPPGVYASRDVACWAGEEWFEGVDDEWVCDDGCLGVGYGPGGRVAVARVCGVVSVRDR